MLIQDLRYALRTLLGNPGLTTVAIFTLALGLGANTAIFTIVDALLLRPLPYAQPGRLVMVWQDLRAQGGPADEWATPGNVTDWRDARHIFSGVAAIGGWRPTLTGGPEAEAIAGEQVSHEYFEVLGTAAAAGRTFTPAEDIPEAPRVAMIGEHLWKRRFGGDPGAIGRTILLGGEPHEIVGVVPADFRPIITSGAEIWRPLRLDTRNPSRGAVVLRVVARLADGVTREQAQASADALATRLESAHPQYNEKTGFNLEPLHDRVVGQVRPGLMALLGGVAFVLLIACANIANLLMAHGAGRRQEMAVRAALGASRGRAVRQLLTESLLLAAVGGIAGLCAGMWAVDALVALAPPNTPRLGEVSLDMRVFGYAGLLTLATGIVFGLAPSLQHSRVDLTSALRDGVRGTPGGGAAVRRGLVVVEMALALMLLTGGVLLVRTFVHLQSADLGFRTEGILTGAVNPPNVPYDTAARHRAFYEQVLERASALPGVQQAALTSMLPLSAGDSDTDFAIDGRPAAPSPSDTPVTWYRMVSAGYFEAIGMPLRRGRGFAPGEAAPAVVVNETFVRTYFPSEDPLGRRLRFSRDGEWFTIIGIVADARVRGARADTRVETFVPYWQITEPGMTVVLRSANPSQLAQPLREAVASIDPNVPVVGIRTMAETFSESIALPRFLATLAAAFAAVAVALAAVGIYGVMAGAVTRRRAEIGVRVALGASAPEVFRLVLGDGLRLAAAGLACGAAGSWLVGRALVSLLFGVAPADPFMLSAAALLLLGVAAAACLVPAWRATRVDPMAALRSS